MNVRQTPLRRRVNAFERTNAATSRQGLRCSRLCIYVYKTLRFAAAKNTEYPVSLSRIMRSIFVSYLQRAFVRAKGGIGTNDVIFSNVSADVGGRKIKWKNHEETQVKPLTINPKRKFLSNQQICWNECFTLKDAFG